MDRIDREKYYNPPKIKPSKEVFKFLLIKPKKTTKKQED